MKINVTWADIKNGKSGKPTECMVALALKRQLGVSYASVGYRDASVSIDGQFTKIYLPVRVQRKIRSWDVLHFAIPFTFELVFSGFLSGPAIALAPNRSAPLSASVQVCLSRPGSVAQIGRRARSSAAFSSCLRHGAYAPAAYRGECASEALAISCSTAVST